MSKNKQNLLYYFLIAALVISSTIGGGYFCCVSAVMSVILLAVIVYIFVHSSILFLYFDINLIAITCLTAGYFLTSLWAIDSWMAFMGGIKFLPVCLFFLILCQIPAQKELLIQLLPLFGSLMTLISFVMMQFFVFQDYVSVAGRLSGFFQYPNTYALFMLVCMLISTYSINPQKTIWISICHTAIALVGIYLSGSRTVIVLTAFALLFISILKKRLRPYSLLGLGLFIIVIAVLFFYGYESGIAARLISTAKNASTFWGRLLYFKDALKLIMAHPFGMGYYGYYFIQSEIQTGVYSVVNVHNEFLQIILDIGILPAFLIYGAILHSLTSKNISERNRLILLIITLHSLFDYDFQFLTIFFILLLFLELENERKIRISVSTKVLAVISLLASIWACTTIGLSDFFFIKGNFQKSVHFYSKNTMAKIELLKKASNAEEMEKLADSILETNKHVAIANSAKARAAFSDGNVENFIKYKLLAIQQAPYQYEEYTDYLDCLTHCVNLYLQTNDLHSAEYCIEQAEKIPQMLENLEVKTSSLGWQIKDQPKVRLSQEDLDRISEMQLKIIKINQ